MAEKVKKTQQKKPAKKPGKAKIVKPKASNQAENVIYPSLRQNILPKDLPAVASQQELLQFWTNVLRASDCTDKDRLRASEYLGKYHQMFVEKSDINLNASGELAAAIVRELSRHGNSK